MGEASQRVPTSSYKINKSWRCSAQLGDYMCVCVCVCVYIYIYAHAYCIVYLKVVKRAGLKSSHHKKIVTM